MRRNGFTIIELMVVLVIISLVAYLSIPRVEEWVARQQARQFAAQLIAEFSKAAALSRTNQNLPQGGVTLPSGTAITKAAIYFMLPLERNYHILARTDSQAGLANWSPTNPTEQVLKTVPLPGRIMIHSVNNATSGPVVIAFTPSGEARDNSGASFPLSPMSCGTTYSSKPYAARIVYKASLRLTPPIFYQLEVNSFGEYRLCQSIGNYSFNETADSEVKSL